MRNMYLLVMVVAFLCLSLTYNNDAFALGGGGFKNEAALDAEANA